jgi:hypothetical protein
MTNTTLFESVVVAIGVLMTSPSLAQANPATPIPVIESSAAQLCNAIDAHPTPGGVADAINAVDDAALDEVDWALVLITAVHHVCPQHDSLIMGSMESAAQDELCPKRTW